MILLRLVLYIEKKMISQTTLLTSARKKAADINNDSPGAFAASAHN